MPSKSSRAIPGVGVGGRRQECLGVVPALNVEPLTDRLAIDRVGHWDAGVTMAFDVVQEPVEPFLPLVGLGVPCPAGQVLEPASTIGLEALCSEFLERCVSTHVPSL